MGTAQAHGEGFQGMGCGGVKGGHVQARKVTGDPGTLAKMQAKQKVGGASEAIRSQIAGLLCAPDRREMRFSSRRRRLSSSRWQFLMESRGL